MIVCVSLNPALDVTYRLDAPLELGGTNRVADVALRPGGKGINVARVLGHVGKHARVVAPLGGATGERVRGEADRLGVDGAWVDVAAETRRTVVAWEVGSGVATTLSENGAPLTAGDWRGIVAAVEELLPADAVVVSGSVPAGLPPDAIAQITHLASASGALVVVDTASPTLGAAIDAGASIVKPNRDELSSLLARSIGRSVRDLADAAHEFRAGRDVAVVASDGMCGLVAVTASGAWHAQPPAISTGNATGAGDACVAGLVAATLDHAPWPSVIRRGAAFGAAAAREPVAGEVGDLADLDGVESATLVEEL